MQYRYAQCVSINEDKKDRKMKRLVILIAGVTLVSYNASQAEMNDHSSLQPSAQLEPIAPDFVTANVQESIDQNILNFEKSTQESISDAFAPDNHENGAYAEVTGTVGAIDGTTATLETQEGEMIISFEQYDNNPLNDLGADAIKTGDRIYAYGDIEEGFFEEHKVIASGHVKLN